MPEGCAPALERLDAARVAKDAPDRVEGLRRKAAVACLGAPAATRPTTRALQPPVAVTPVSPVVPDPPGRPTAPPGMAAPPPPATIDRPAMIGNCDGSGCWDAQGRRLGRFGDVLIGPRGPCVAQGSGFVCP